MSSPIKVRRNSKGIYYARPYLGRDVNGRPIRPHRLFPEAASEAEAQRMAEEWAQGFSASAGMHIGNTVGEIADQYLRTLKAKKASPNTIRTYESLLRCYVRPMFGRMAPSELRPYMVESFYTEMLVEGACGRDKVAAGTVRKLHGFMKGLYKWMHRNEILEIDPMRSVEPPPKDVHEAVAFDGAQVAKINAFLDKVFTDKGSAAFERSAAMCAYLSLWNGIRVGEGCALWRSDADVGRKLLLVHANAVEDGDGVERRDKTKGKRSRNLSMPDPVCERLGEHWRWQEGKFGDRAKEGSFPICASSKGGIIRPSDVSKWFSRVRDREGLPKKSSFHSLRHTHASVLLMEGMDVKTIAERLGHARESLTLETYSHVMPGRDKAAGEAFAGFAERIAS